MRQLTYGLILLFILAIPPVANLLESIMIVHMHMQMPLLVFSGFLMAGYFLKRFPNFFRTWNQNGHPGILLFIIISIYWMIPRTMDEALTVQAVEVFKFISLPFLAGIPLRDSWKKMSERGQNLVLYVFILLFLGIGWLYIVANEQFCNNYLLIEQITLGWGYVATAVCMGVYVLYNGFIDFSKYE
ncbi:hypothetical protein GCM10008967_35210 [Bacillus carboniphilus]|uniref:Uncharacterized protein n=1 Tax=Bacillus carboniphilus TaxID=86663 RepID=A0ABN0WM83_9BACI